MARLPAGTVTFLFTDVDLGPGLPAQAASLRHALQRQDTILREAVEANGGYAYKTIGYAIQAAFPTASDALAAAVAAQLALASQDWSSESTPAVPVPDQPAPAAKHSPPDLRVRMALHTGSTEERGGDYSGPLLNRVARMVAACHGGQIILSQATEELARDSLLEGVVLRDLGEHRLRDRTNPEHIFQVVIPALPSDFPPLKTLEGRANNLPLQPTPLIGRDKEVAACCALLRSDDVWLVTLTGPGGIGKTRVALQVAADLLDDFRDGTFFVSLGAISDPDLVASSIAGALDVQEARGKPLTETLTEYLRDKQLLLLLDNFEQVAAAAPLIQLLLQAAPQLKVLVTSRMPLQLSRERELPVPPLHLPDLAHLPSIDVLPQYEAVALFIDRATAARPDFKVTNENALAIAEICHRLDGSPLAIELAAARIKLLSPQMMLSRLAGSLKLLTGGALDLPARQQTLRATIDWSYLLLDAVEQLLFARMGIFVGGCTLEAADTVVSGLDDGGKDSAQLTPSLDRPSSVVHRPSSAPTPEIDVLDGLSSLVNKSLLQQREMADGEPRFFMLETIREYAQERLEEIGELDALRRVHAECYLELAERALPLLRGPEQVAWLGRLDREHDNFRAAVEWCIQAPDADETGLRLVSALWPFWWRCGYLTEGRTRVAAALSRAEGSPAISQELRGDALYAAGYLAFLQGDYVAARPLFEQTVAMMRSLGNSPSAKRRIARSLAGLSQSNYHLGDYEPVRPLLEESLALHRELGDKPGTVTSLNNLGLNLAAGGDYDGAWRLLEEALATARSLSDKWGISTVLNNLGLVARLRRRVVSGPDPRSLVQESLRIRRDMADKYAIAFSLAGLAATAAQDAADAAGRQGAGDAMRAARLLGATECLLQTIGARLEPLYHEEYQRTEAAARRMVGDAIFEAAHEDGRKLSLDQAMAYALEEYA
jgi:predicted ATPase/class 3 adenylate cyclase